MWRCAFEPSTWSNWALVLIGFAGVWAALWTLSTIKEQTKLLRESVAVSKKSIDIIVAKERARLELVPEYPAIASIHDPVLKNAVHYKLRLQGTTPATIVETRAWAQITDSLKPFQTGSYTQLFIPTILLPASKDIEGEVYMSVPDSTLSNPIDIGDLVRSRKLFVHFYGYIRYEDIFEGKWRYPFRYIWLAELNNTGKWIRSDVEADNTETKDHQVTATT